MDAFVGFQIVCIKYSYLFEIQVQVATVVNVIHDGGYLTWNIWDNSLSMISHLQKCDYKLLCIIMAWDMIMVQCIDIFPRNFRMLDNDNQNFATASSVRRDYDFMLPFLYLWCFVWLKSNSVT